MINQSPHVRPISKINKNQEYCPYFILETSPALHMHMHAQGVVGPIGYVYPSKD
jgi:hypothetical protein